MDQSRQFFKPLNRWYQQILPNYCVLCDSPSAHPLCNFCVSNLPIIEHCCERCALPLPADAELCGECLQRPPAFDSAISVFSYQAQIPWLINQFKHRRQHAIGKQLTRACVNALPSNADYDQIIPVPLHWARLLQRGFNQAERIAMPVAQHLQRPLVRAVRKTRLSKHQQNLTRKQRLANAKLNFEVCRDVDQQRILLVDDVMTTGATLESISTLLRRAGAAEITVLTLARTPKQTTYK